MIFFEKLEYNTMGYDNYKFFFFLLDNYINFPKILDLNILLSCICKDMECAKLYKK